MNDASKSNQPPEETDDTTRAGSLRGGAGRKDEIPKGHPGVWPAEGPHPDNPDIPVRTAAEFGQGDRGAAGYVYSGESEFFPLPPSGEPESDAQTGSGQ
jgi:hypothetical protein